MIQRFLALAAAEPVAPAIVDGHSGRVITRAALAARALEISREFEDAGLRRGELIAAQLPNSAEFVAAFLAAMKQGLVIAFIDRDAAETEVATILGHFGVRAMIYRADDADDRCAVSTRAVHARVVLPEEARLLKLTSGSTGTPKAIVWSEANIEADARNICSTMRIAPADVNLGAIPFSHSYGFSNLVSPLAMQGTPVVVSNDYLPLSLIGMANRHACTVAPLIPMVYEHLASLPKEDGTFWTLRTLVSAGAPLMPGTSRRFRERFGKDVHSFYGCSEVGGITYDRAGAAVERGSVGAALDGVGLELDESTRRLTVRSEAVAVGYLYDSGSFEPLHGRFRTDDLVELTPEGEVMLTGRAGDLINVAGKKVNPREVEQVILQIEGVRDVKVYGTEAGARGEVVAAAVVANPDVTREQIREFCQAHLSLHKVPRIVKLIEQLPLDERGKVKRAALAAL